MISLSFVNNMLPSIIPRVDEYSQLEHAHRAGSTKIHLSVILKLSQISGLYTIQTTVQS